MFQTKEETQLESISLKTIILKSDGYPCIDVETIQDGGCHPLGRIKKDSRKSNRM